VNDVLGFCIIIDENTETRRLRQLTVEARNSAQCPETGQAFMPGDYAAKKGTGFVPVLGSEIARVMSAT
jgi:hypothetical protein